MPGHVPRRGFSHKADAYSKKNALERNLQGCLYGIQEAGRRALGAGAEPDALLRDALVRLGLPPRITAEARPTLEAALKAAKKS